MFSAEENTEGWTGGRSKFRWWKKKWETEDFAQGRKDLAENSEFRK